MISFSLRTVLWLFILIVLLPMMAIDFTTSLIDYALLDSRLHALIGVFSVIFSAIAYKAFESSVQDEHFFNVVKIPDTGIVDVSYGQMFLKIKNIGFCYYHGQLSHHFKINSRLSKIVIFFIFVALGFNIFNQREINVLSNLSKFESKERFCKIEEEKKTAAEVRPECRLIFRAYELGYAKDLGSCGVDQEEAPKPCDLKYEDEPFFHYAFRKAKVALQQINKISQESSPEKIKQIIDKDMNRFEPMVKERLADLNNDPRSVHIVLTNLPPPDIGVIQKISRALKPSSCITEYRRLPNKAEFVKSRAKLGNTFHFTTGHLLFDTAYETTVANCMEYTFKWEVLPEVCEAGIKSPEEMLKKQNLLGKVNQLVDRIERRKVTNPAITPPATKEVSSVQCLSFGEFHTQMESKTFTYRGHQFNFVWKRVSIPSMTTETPLRVFRESAHTFNPAFRYSQISSKQSLNLSSEISVTEELFNESGFLLTRLGFLRDTDIFIGSEWLLQRSDLLDLFPYYLHLNHFIESFRQRYKENFRRM